MLRRSNNQKIIFYHRKYNISSQMCNRGEDYTSYCRNTFFVSKKIINTDIGYDICKRKVKIIDTWPRLLNLIHTNARGGETNLASYCIFNRIKPGCVIKFCSTYVGDDPSDEVSIILGTLNTFLTPLKLSESRLVSGF